MRNYMRPCAEGSHQLMTGPDMDVPMHQVNLSHKGASLAEIHALGVSPGQWVGRSGKASWDPGGPQAGLSVGGFGQLYRAGRP